MTKILPEAGLDQSVSGAPAATRRRTAGWWWLALSAAAIAVLAPLPYLGDSLHGLAADDNDLAANYADRAGWLQAAFYLHITCGGTALLLSPVQFAARLRAKAPRVHRISGRIALSAMLLAGIAGLILAPFSLAGAVGAAGFGTLAVLWVTFAVAAYRAIRRRDVTAHRRWAVRAFAMTYAAVTLRLWLGLLIPLQVGVDPDTAFHHAYLLVPFLCWVPNLLVAERFLRASPPAVLFGRAPGRRDPRRAAPDRSSRMSAPQADQVSKPAADRAQENAEHPGDQPVGGG